MERFVINRVEDCRKVNPNNRRSLKPWLIKYLVIHRISLALRDEGNPDPIPDKELNGPELARRFLNKKLGTGGLIPYGTLITHDAVCEQLLSLQIKGAHARGYNSRSLSIAVVGNSDERPISLEQHQMLTRVCSVLAPVNDGLEIIGHTDLPGAAKDPNKRCPGRYLPLGQIIGKVSVCLEPHTDQWRQIELAGFEL